MANLGPNILIDCAGYSALPKYDDKEGLVSLVFKKKQAEVEAGIYSGPNIFKGRINVADL